MAIPSSALPAPVLLDGRWAYSQYDGNNNLVVYPISINSPAISAATASAGVAVDRFGERQDTFSSTLHTIKSGPDIGASGLAFCSYNSVNYWIKTGVPVTLPQFLTDILTAQGTNYVVNSPVQPASPIPDPPAIVAPIVIPPPVPWYKRWWARVVTTITQTLA